MSGRNLRDQCAQIHNRGLNISPHRQLHVPNPGERPSELKDNPRHVRRNSLLQFGSIHLSNSKGRSRNRRRLLNNHRARLQNAGRKARVGLKGP